MLEILANTISCCKLNDWFFAVPNGIAIGIGNEIIKNEHNYFIPHPPYLLLDRLPIYRLVRKHLNL
jgi:hypothetical protein